jgi:hypothetical protein
MSRAARSGPLGGDPHDGPGGRREVPFGPEISWPYGFRQMDPESRDLIESAYRPGPGYQQPALDDYGDPGYSDPSYEGPKTPYNGRAFPGQGASTTNAPAPRPYLGSGYRPSGPVPGYHGPEIRDSSRPGGAPRAGTGAYPEQWYDHPRLDDRVAGDLRRPEPQGPASGQRPGSGFMPNPGRSAGYGQSGGHGQPRGPQMSAGPRTGPGAGQPGSPSAAGDSAARDAGFLGAPVGLLTPPRGTRVRPGHGLDGPEITSSWPAQPAPDDLQSFDDFWREDEDEEYSGLFGDRGAEFDRADAKQAASKQAAGKRSTGRRRGRSNDLRLWLGLGGVVVVAAAAIVGIVKFEFPSHSGPAHTLSIPDTIGDYTRTVGLERSTDVAQLSDEVVAMSSGQATGVKSAVYREGDSAAGNTEQIIMFIGGHLANADPAASVSSFTQKFPGARVVGAGALGGQAACVQEGTAANAVAMCAWFDNDSFGEIVSPTMNASALGQALQTVRPAVEHLAPK